MHFLPPISHPCVTNCSVFVRYIRSLARCVKYDAKGGKSRSTFCKVAGTHAARLIYLFKLLNKYYQEPKPLTRSRINYLSLSIFYTHTHTLADDRFIMKHIKSIEISSFEQFAPHYLEHVNKALEEKVSLNPCTLRLQRLCPD